MSKIRIGKVAITHEGEWNINKTYEINTCVTYAGSTYITLKQVKGIQPINDGVNYRLMASKGDKGERGTDGSVSFGSLTATQKNSLKGEKGDKGDRGYYYIPNVDKQGNLSWQNNGELDNPPTINLKGPKGSPGNMFHIGIEDGNLILTPVLEGSEHFFEPIGEDGNLYLNIEDMDIINIEDMDDTNISPENL